MKRILCLSVLAVLSGCAEFPMQASSAPPPAIPVFFEPWSAALDNHALSAIASAAQTARTNPHERLVVIGAADATGSTEANRFISMTRAQVVSDQLAADGVDPSQIRLRGAGTVPAPAAPGQAAQYARRVLISFTS